MKSYSSPVGHAILSRSPGPMRMICFAISCAAMLAGVVSAQEHVDIEWNNVRRVNRSNASLQAVVTPLMDWETGRPNARYWALKLLNENFGPGDKLLLTTSTSPGVYAQAFLTTFYLPGLATQVIALP